MLFYKILGIFPHMFCIIVRLKKSIQHITHMYDPCKKMHLIPFFFKWSRSIRFLMMIQDHICHVGVKRIFPHIPFSINTMKSDPSRRLFCARNEGLVVILFCNILRQRIVMHQRTRCQILNGIPGNSHFLCNADAHVCNTFCVSCCNMNQFTLHTV